MQKGIIPNEPAHHLVKGMCESEVVEVYIVSGIVRVSGLGIGKFGVYSKLHQGKSAESIEV